jgi:hypothetical protein
MTEQGDRRIASIFGILGAVFLGIEALVDLLRGVVYFALRHGTPGVSALGQSVLLLVMALLIGFFAVLGSTRGSERSLVVGVVLIVLAVIGWAALGFGASVLGLVGSILVLVSGIVFLVAGR